MLSLKANPKRPASGTVIEALLDRGKGPLPASGAASCSRGTPPCSSATSSSATRRRKSPRRSESRRAALATTLSRSPRGGVNRCPRRGSAHILAIVEKTRRVAARGLGFAYQLRTDMSKRKRTRATGRLSDRTADHDFEEEARNRLLERRTSLLHGRAPSRTAQPSEQAAELDAVQRALNRIADGTYGICCTCGATIGEDQLRTVPETPICGPCSSQT